MAGFRQLMGSSGFRTVLLALAAAFVVADIAIAAVGLGGPSHRSGPPAQPGQVQVPTTTGPGPTTAGPTTTGPTTTGPGTTGPGGPATTVPPTQSPAGGATPLTLPYTL